VRAGELAAMLAKDAQRVAEFLCPGGKREGSEYRCGSIDGGEGESLGVHLTGTKAGVWKDFASGGKGGDLIGLWQRARGVSLTQAMKEAADYLGVQEPKFHGSHEKTYRKPAVQHRAPLGKVEAYLTGRGLTLETLRAFRIRASEDGEDILLPYMRDNELVNAKWLKVDRPAGKKVMRMEKDCAPILFGWQCVPEDARSIVLCEGEIDAMSLFQLGRPALSVPNGASGMQWVEIEYPHLERFDEIFICFDQDDAGRKGAQEVAERLGRERCRLVKLPTNDANDALLGGCDAAAMDAYCLDAKSIDPPELRGAADFQAQVIEEFYPPDNARVGFLSPWPALNGRIAFRPTEVIVLNGINGHGKSQALGHMMLHAMNQDERVCIASLEMQAHKWIARLCRQATATAEPTIAYLKAVHSWLDGKLWAFDKTGTADTNRMLEVFKYARRRYGVTVFAIDSLLKCGIADDDYGAQKLWVEKLCDFAIQHQATVFLITHSRKLESEKEQSDKMDVKGSGSITDLACTVLNVWRNKRKEENPEKHVDEADVIFSCQKQRYGDWEGRKWLWFDKSSFQYLETSNARPESYVAFSRLSVVSNHE
jgi:twinkle protein